MAGVYAEGTPPHHRSKEASGKKPATGVPDILDRTPPFDSQAEIGVLGSMILSVDAADEAVLLLRTDDFYDSANGLIYAALKEIQAKGKQADPTLLRDTLAKAGHWETIGGAAYLSKIINGVPNAAHCRHYCDIVHGYSLQRQAIVASTETLKEAYERTDKPREIIERAEARMFEIMERGLENDAPVEPVADVFIRAMERMEARHAGQHVQGVRFGLGYLDSQLGGLKEGQLVILGGRPSNGKCLGRGTPILMFDGTVKPAESIAVGDRLMGPDSFPRKVLTTTSGRAPMYWVRQSYAMHYRCNGDHILMLKRIKTEKKQNRGLVREMTVNDALKKPASFWSRWHGYKTGVRYGRSLSQPIEPYFLGLWLGDGSAASARVTTADAEIVAYLRAYAERRGERLSIYIDKRGNKASTYTIRGRNGGDWRNPYVSICVLLRRIGVLNNKSIPREYLIASREQRLELLAGLVDSDGHYCYGGNAYEIVMTDRLLISQIKTLADGLGFRARVNPKDAVCNGKHFDAWRLTISGAIHEIPVLIERKKPTKIYGGTCNRDPLTTRIAIEPDGVDDYFGFEIDGDGQFLLEDGTVTHNTAAGIGLALYAAHHDQDQTLFISLEMSKLELADRMLTMFAEIDSFRMQKGHLTHDERQHIIATVSNLGTAPIWIEDSPSRTVTQIAALARRHKRKHGLKLLIVDYLQLIEPEDHGEKGVTREQQVAKISRRLKILARELSVPVVLMAQVNRKSDDRGQNECPRLSHLRESGAIEQDADIVIFVHRPAVADMSLQVPAMQGEPCKIVIAKQRNGPVGEADAFFFRGYSAFKSYADADGHTPSGQEWNPNGATAPAGGNHGTHPTSGPAF